MKVINSSFSIVLFCVGMEVYGQSGFQNLDFESANLNSIPAGQYGGNVATSDGIPGWTAYTGPIQVTQMLQNNITLGTAGIDILGPSAGSFLASSIIDGSYSIVLQPGQGYNGTSFGLVGASISQTGLVPMNSLSLEFKANAADSFYVSLGGQNLNVVQLGTGENYTLYGANVSQFAGQTENLTIGVNPLLTDVNIFDSFVFSPTPVPEPSSLLVVTSGLVVLIYSKKIHHKKCPSLKIIKKDCLHCS